MLARNVHHESIIENNFRFLFNLQPELQVTWAGENIVVFNDVTIKPPYKVEDVNGNSESMTYVKKIVEKFVLDQAALAQPEVAT